LALLFGQQEEHPARKKTCCNNPKRFPSRIQPNLHQPQINMLVKEKTILCGANYSNCISLYTLASLSVLLTRTLEQGPGQEQGLRWQGPGPGPGLECQ